VEIVRKPRLPGEEEMKCVVCQREAVSDLCVYHAEARENLRLAYPMWEKAYGGIEWKAFLDNVKRSPQTGQWAREIAEFLQGD
jgi:hypothetical protein